jgi:aspartate 1-decarboxylase
MQRTMLKSKLHRVRVTHSELDYEGSCAIDEELLDAADIREYQQIEIAAARKAAPGDILIIATYAIYNELELEKFKPELVYVDAMNRIKDRRREIPVQAA